MIRYASRDVARAAYAPRVAPRVTMETRARCATRPADARALFTPQRAELCHAQRQHALVIAAMIRRRVDI